MLTILGLPAKLDELEVITSLFSFSPTLSANSFIELLERYQEELDRRIVAAYDREQLEYEWLESAGILD